MKKLIPVLCCFLATTVFGQSLQNQSVLFDREPDQVYPVLQGLASDPTDYNDYGGKLGIGICILDGFGVPFRYYATPKSVLEAGLYTSGVSFQYNDELKIGTGLSFAGGASFFGNRFLKEKKKINKVRAHGVAFRARQLFGNFATTSGTLGWAMETFKENRMNRSFIFELGLQGSFPDFTYNGLLYDEPGVGIYLRCHWNFFIR